MSYLRGEAYNVLALQVKNWQDRPITADHILKAWDTFTTTEHAELLLEKKYDSEFHIRILSLLKSFWTQPIAE